MLFLKGRTDGGVWWQAFFFWFDDFMMCQSDKWRYVMVLIASLTWQLSVPADPGGCPRPAKSSGNWLVCLLNRRVCNQFSSYHWHLIWWNSGVALCIHHSFFNFPLSLSLSLLFGSVRLCSHSTSVISLLSRGFQNVLKKRKENTWQRVHTLFSSAYSDPFRFIWDLNCKVNQQKKKIGCKWSHFQICKTRESFENA